MMEFTYGNDGESYRVLAESSDMTSSMEKEIIQSFCGYEYPKDFSCYSGDDQYPECIRYATVKNSMDGSAEVVIVKSGKMTQFSRACFFSHAVVIPANMDFFKYDIFKLFEMRFFNAEQVLHAKGETIANAIWYKKEEQGRVELSKSQIKALLELAFYAMDQNETVRVVLDQGGDNYNDRARYVLETLFCYLPYNLRKKCSFSSFGCGNSNAYHVIELYDPLQDNHEKRMDLVLGKALLGNKDSSGRFEAYERFIDKLLNYSEEERIKCFDVMNLFYGSHSFSIKEHAALENFAKRIESGDIQSNMEEWIQFIVDHHGEELPVYQILSRKIIQRIGTEKFKSEFFERLSNTDRPLNEWPTRLRHFAYVQDYFPEIRISPDCVADWYMEWARKKKDYFELMDLESLKKSNIYSEWYIGVRDAFCVRASIIKEKINEKKHKDELKNWKIRYLNDIQKMQQKDNVDDYNMIYCTECNGVFRANELSIDMGKALNLILKSQKNQDSAYIDKWHAFLSKIDLGMYWDLHELEKRLLVKTWNIQSSKHPFEFDQLAEFEFTVGDMVDYLQENQKRLRLASLTHEKTENGCKGHDFGELINQLLDAVFQVCKNRDEIIAKAKIKVCTCEDDEGRILLDSIQLYDYDKNTKTLIASLGCTCPWCGRRMPAYAGRYASYLIGVLGLGQSGKKTYINKLMQNLKDFQNRSVRMALEEGLETVKMDPRKTFQLIPMPLWIQDKRVTITFAVIQENLIDGKRMRNEKLGNTSLNEILSNLNFMWCCISADQIENRYLSVMYEYLNNLETEMDMIYMAQIVTKSDLLNTCNSDEEGSKLYHSEIANVMYSFMLDGYLELDNVKEHMHDVSDYLSKYCNSKLKDYTLHELFRGVGNFSVSAGKTGVGGLYNSGKNVVQPSLLELPLLWTLSLLGLLKARKYAQWSQKGPLGIPVKKEGYVEVKSKAELFLNEGE